MIESASILSFFQIYLRDSETLVLEKAESLLHGALVFVIIHHRFRIQREIILSQNGPPQLLHLITNYLGISCNLSLEDVDGKPFLVFSGSSSFRLTQCTDALLHFIIKRHQNLIAAEWLKFNINIMC